MGATGVIGQKTLEICREFPEKLKIVGISAHQNFEKLQNIAAEFAVENLFLTQKDFEKFCEFLKTADFDKIILAGLGTKISKCAEIAIARGKSVAIATKEILVFAGEKLRELSQKTGGEILPIDSEISAIWQCLRGENPQNISRIFLTASGGPFLDAKKFPKSFFPKITPKMAIAHPKWKMGAKISVDSATLFNKSFEMMEIAILFRVPPEKIEILIHPDAEIHSAVEFSDGSIKAQISAPEMKIPISRALFFPEISPKNFAPNFSFFSKKWDFFSVDENRFPSIKMARRAISEKKMVEFLRENDAAVADFLRGKIRFDEIFSRVEKIF